MPRPRRMTRKPHRHGVVLSVLLGVVMAHSCASRRETAAGPFRYESVIAQIAPDPSADRRNELRRCVDLWTPFARQRANVFREMTSRDGRDAVLLEVGNAGWSLYAYALLVDDDLLSPGNPGKTSGALARVLGGIEMSDLHSYVTPGVDDGPCWFLTVLKSGRAAQVAWYGPLDDSRTSRTIHELEQYLQEPGPDQKAR
jgi:hypothetical protein